MSYDSASYESASNGSADDTTARTVEEIDAAEADSAAAGIIDQLQAQLIDFRRDLHQHPELSWQEHRTTEQIAAALQQAGLLPQRLPHSTGLYVDIGAADAPIAAAFRADIDALPLAETTGLDYASAAQGIAHACGHDIHTAVMLGVALTCQQLHQRRPLGARVRVIFQPAEEQLPGGALEVIREGILESVPRVFALHCDPKLIVGEIGTRIGPMTSASDVVRINVTGSGGHTSRPHLTQDVVGALGHLSTVVPAVLSRRIDIRSGISLVWGHIHAGSVANAIPTAGTLHGTLRILDAEVWKAAGDVLEPVVQQAAAAYGVTVELDHVRGVPPVYNSDPQTMLIEAAARRTLGEGCLTLAEQSMGGEDFGWMTQEVPGAMFRLGTMSPQGVSYDLHRGDYAPDEGAIAVGVSVMTAVAQAAVTDLDALEPAA